MTRNSHNNNDTMLGSIEDTSNNMNRTNGSTKKTRITDIFTESNENPQKSYDMRGAQGIGKDRSSHSRRYSSPGMRNNTKSRRITDTINNNNSESNTIQFQQEKVGFIKKKRAGSVSLPSSEVSLGSTREAMQLSESLKKSKELPEFENILLETSSKGQQKPSPRGVFQEKRQKIIDTPIRQSHENTKKVNEGSTGGKRERLSERMKLGKYRKGSNENDSIRTHKTSQNTHLETPKKEPLPDSSNELPTNFLHRRIEWMPLLDNGDLDTKSLDMTADQIIKRSGPPLDMTRDSFDFTEQSVRVLMSAMLYINPYKDDSKWIDLYHLHSWWHYFSFPVIDYYPKLSVVQRKVSNLLGLYEKYRLFSELGDTKENMDDGDMFDPLEDGKFPFSEYTKKYISQVLKMVS